MWNKRNEPEYPPRQNPVKPNGQDAFAQEPPRAVPPPQPPRATQPETARPPASIGPSMSIKGDIRSKEELFIDGEIEGTIESQHRVTVGPHGKVRASVKAREVVVLGSIHGNVETVEKISIRKDGRLVGDIKTAGIVIDDGAYFKGSIDIVRSEQKQQAPKPQPLPQSETAVPV
jgi:cytoskeletal protein CcmA (bactofilin family)